MLGEKRDLLNLLKRELSFIDHGGYRKSTNQPWRMPLIFEDSPICMYYDCPEKRDRCDGCPLVQLVPEHKREERMPCRHIPLNAAGDTLDSLYRWANSQEIEEATANWLRSEIKKLEAETVAIEKEETKAIARSAANHGEGAKFLN